ncbi:hypothetical protein ACFSTE_14545 [Aquimarina hainanensis]|uniref:Uncharacterized protein n=2 Tax=Aquimarina hainanensis TaxID=1578017 RepID=A0ABW5N8V9_9FLAO
MDRTAFKGSTIISILNNEYYAIKMNPESTDTIVFGNDIFINEHIGKKRHSTHKIPLLLVSRRNHPFSLSAIIILDKKFEIITRYFKYLSPIELIQSLKNY